MENILIPGGKLELNDSQQGEEYNIVPESDI